MILQVSQCSKLVTFNVNLYLIVCMDLIYNSAWQALFFCLGEPLVQRPDDRPDTVLKRLESYKEMTEPLLTFYKKKKQLKSFTGETSDVIWVDVKKYIDELS